MHIPVRLAALAASAALALPLSTALAKDKDERSAAPTPAPVLADTGPLSVSGMSFLVGSFVDAATGLPGPLEVHARAVVGGAGHQVYDEVRFDVRPAGGEWDRSLDFPYAAQPVAVGGYAQIMLSSARSFAPGTYEVRVAARQGETWIHDEAVSSFTMP